MKKWKVIFVILLAAPAALFTSSLSERKITHLKNQ